MLHVKTDEIYGKNEVVNSNDLRKHLVNIDSRFRKSHLEPPTDFLYPFAHSYKNVIKARVASVEIPIGFYNFSKVKKNTMFRLDVTDYVGIQHFLQITIPDGDYTPLQLVKAIQEQLNAIRDTYGLFFRITFDESTRKVTICHDGSGPPPCPRAPTHTPVAYGLTFAMVGLEDRRYDFGLGYNLGFSEHFYTVEAPFCVTGESLISTTGDNYFLLAIDDFYTVEHRTNDDYIQCLAKILVKKNHSGIIFDDGYTVLSNDIIFPRPVDLKQVRVRLVDMYGIPIELHNLNFSISLEITEVMNVQMYDNYRGYLWNKEEPRAVYQTSGSSAIIAPPARNYN
uniref:Uncharacterized protein n=1 Tax=viral metagenome TaxID=1070528 RepID=A0A6C0KVG1_9ZZZZ